jgi:hypothetical protein
MEQQAIVNHAIRQRDIPALPDSWVIQIRRLSKCCVQKKILFLIKCKGKIKPGTGHEGPEGK